MPREYSPEMTRSYLDSVLTQVDTQEGEDEGLARREAAAGGLAGIGSLGGKVGAARRGAADRKSQITSAFDLDVANKDREERMIGQKENFQADQAQKDRDLREKLAQMEFQQASGRQASQQGFERVMGQQGLVTGLGAGLLTRGAGGYLASLGMPGKGGRGKGSDYGIDAGYGRASQDPSYDPFKSIWG